MAGTDAHVALIEDLSVGHQQRVEILKALYRQADILILDEPTGVLTPDEADHLFRILKGLKDQGKTVILITHKLREIMEATDNVSVMRRGTMVATVKTAETSPEQLAELMVGRKVLLEVDKGTAKPGEVVLSVQYKDAEEWYAVTGGRAPLADPAALEAVHSIAVGLLHRPEG